MVRPAVRLQDLNLPAAGRARADSGEVGAVKPRFQGETGSGDQTKDTTRRMDSDALPLYGGSYQ